MRNNKLTKGDIKNMRTLKWRKELKRHISDNSFAEFSMVSEHKNSYLLCLHHYGTKRIACVKKLSSAKTIAQLINNG